jgi:hypothetical protein
MAQAAYKHTPTDWISLNVLLRYLSLAPFAHSIDRALHEIWQRISSGELRLKVEHHVDGKLQSYEIDPFYFRANYTLELDSYSLVRVVRRGGLQWGRRDYKVAVQDALALWPSHPPASQTAPAQQLEDKTGTGHPLATLPASDPPSTKPTIVWITAEARQLKADGKITKGMSKTELASLLEHQSEGAAEAGKLKKQLTLRYIRNQLDAWGLWPISSIK